MRYKTHINTINKIIREYIETVNHTAELKAMADVKTNEVISDPKYSKEWKEEIKKRDETDTRNKIRAIMKKDRDPVYEAVQALFALIQKDIDSFFSGSISTEFGNNLMYLQNLGVKLTYSELEALQSRASTYMELRALQQFADNNISKSKPFKTEDGLNIQAETGADAINEMPFVIDLPNINRVYEAFGRYKQNINHIINGYSGKNDELFKMIYLEDLPNYNTTMPTGQAPAFIIDDGKKLDKTNETFIKALDNATKVMPINRVKTALTEQDKALIDTLVDKNSLNPRNKVREIVRNSSELADLLALDERYAKYVEEMETEMLKDNQAV